MNIVRTAACFFLGVFVQGQALGQIESEVAHEPVAVVETRAVRVDRLFTTWNRKDSPGCSVLVVENGKVLYTRGFGMANLEYGVKNRPSTIFHIASISKQFTAFAIMLLAQDGKLSLDDDVRKYLPELHDFGKTITLRHLLHHTSGLRDQWDLVNMAGWRFEDVITEDDILRLVWRQRELNFNPGAEFDYCNTGYTLLGLIVKRVSGKTLARFCDERIFRPLGMTHTHFHDDVHLIVPNRAYSYEPLPKGGFRISVLSYANVGATSLFTTVEDLAKWDSNFYSGKVGGKAAIEEMHRKGKLNNGKEIDYAAAIEIGSYRGLKTVEHGGADAGYRSDLLRFPDQHLSVIVLSNLGSFDTGGIARKVAEFYLADKLAPLEGAPASGSPGNGGLRKEVKVSDSILESYTGDYQLGPIYLTFHKEGNALFVEPSGQEKFPVFASSETEFFLKVAEVQLTFEKGKGPKAEAVVIHQNGQNLRAARVVRALPTPEELAEYVGDYYSDELGVIYSLSVKGGSPGNGTGRQANEFAPTNGTKSASADSGQLWIRYSKGELPLNPVKKDSFSAPYPFSEIRFARLPNGHVGAMTISTGRVRNLKATKSTIRPAE